MQGLPRLVVLLSLCCAPLLDASEDDVIARTSLGDIKGVKELSSGGRTFNSFKGIPFAQPPVEALRFQRPQPVKPWTTVLDATDYRPFCLQWEFDDKIHGDENCLYLNVHTPKLSAGKESSGLPVMVWIHGGSYTIGAGQFYGSSKLMNKDVVSVSINYRLGPFGFLSTGDEELPGNLGMYDQVAALQWIHDNIRAFGGDPASVTLVGNSAGSASALFHMLSPASTGLFHGVIAHSGSPLCSWAFQEKPNQHAVNIGKELNCPVSSSKELMECLNNLPAHDIITASHKFVDGIFYPIVYAPVAEKAGEQRFLADNPLVLLEANKIVNRVPVIAGVTGDEGILFYNRALFHNKKFDQAFFDDKFPELIANFTDIEGNLDTVGDVLKSLYLPDLNSNSDKDVIKAMSDIAGDALFYAANDQTIKYLHKHGIPVYMFVFTYHSGFSIMDLVGGPRGGAAHVDDIFYIYDFGLLPYTLNAQDQVISNQLITMWTNFAKNREPTSGVTAATPVEWPRFTNEHPRYLLIDKQTTVEQGFRQEKAELWNYVLPQIAAVQQFTREEL